MKKTTHWTFLALLGVAVAAPAQAQSLFAYPEQGQTAEQQQKDEYECSQWATQRTGVNPSQTAPPPQSSTGDQAARGAVRGAIAGLAIANIAGGSGSSGAAAGAVFGGLGGAARGNRQSAAQQQQAAEATSNFNRAYAACLEGRGYSVK